MYALFPAAGWVIIGAMVAVEVAKFVTAESAYDDWKLKGGWFKRAYKSMAVVALMSITAMGVYGFLAKGHLEQSAPLAPVQLQIAQREARLAQLNGELTRITAQQQQMDASLNSVIGQATTARDARAGLRARSGAASERRAMQTRIDTINAEMNTVNQALVPLKIQVSEVATKLGPLQYVADLFGWKDPEAAVRLIILLLMFAFDPLAIVLMIDGTERLVAWSEKRREIDEDEEEPEAEPVAEPEPEPEPVAPSPAPVAEDEIDEPLVPAPAPPPIFTTPPVMFDSIPTYSLFGREIKDNWEPSSEGNLLLELDRLNQERRNSIEEHEPEPEPEERTEKEQLLDLLDRNPGFIDDIVDAVEETRAQPEWLTAPKRDDDA